MNSSPLVLLFLDEPSWTHRWRSPSSWSRSGDSICPVELHQFDRSRGHSQRTKHKWMKSQLLASMNIATHEWKHKTIGLLSLSTIMANVNFYFDRFYWLTFSGAKNSRRGATRCRSRYCPILFVKSYLAILTWGVRKLTQVKWQGFQSKEFNGEWNVSFYNQQNTLNQAVEDIPNRRRKAEARWTDVKFFHQTLSPTQNSH